MNRFVAIAFDAAIIALIGFSLLSNPPLMKKEPTTGSTMRAQATDARALAERWPH